MIRWYCLRISSVFALTGSGRKQPPVFVTKAVLKNFALFTEKYLSYSLFLLKNFKATLLKKKNQHRCFLVNTPEHLRSPVLKRSANGCFYQMLFRHDQSKGEDTLWNISLRPFHKHNLMDISLHLIWFHEIRVNYVGKSPSRTVKWIQKWVQCSICYWQSIYFLKILQSKRQKEKGV